MQSPVEPGWVRAQLPAASAGAAASRGTTIVADLDRVVVPGLTHWQSPNFFGFFPANASGPSILGDLVSSGARRAGDVVGDQPGVHRARDPRPRLAGRAARPACALPQRRRGRRRDPGLGVERDAVRHPRRSRPRAARDDLLDRLRAYTSTQAHSSVEKAIRVAGLRPDQLRLIDVDDDVTPCDPTRWRRRSTRTSPPGWSRSSSSPRSARRRRSPSTRSTRSPTSATRNDIWLHVDAAMAGAAAVVPELRPLVNGGLERVDSWCFDPHKWLLTNFDCDVLYVADRSAAHPLAERAARVPAQPASESGAVIDYRDWHIPLGRRFRALKLWFVLRHYGAEGLRITSRRASRRRGGWRTPVDADDRFERLAPTDLSLVCFAHRDGDERNRGSCCSRSTPTGTRLPHAHPARTAGTRSAWRSAARTPSNAHVEALWIAARIDPT